MACTAHCTVQHVVVCTLYRMSLVSGSGDYVTRRTDSINYFVLTGDRFNSEVNTYHSMVTGHLLRYLLSLLSSDIYGSSWI